VLSSTLFRCLQTSRRRSSVMEDGDPEHLAVGDGVEAQIGGAQGLFQFSWRVVGSQGAMRITAPGASWAVG